MTLRSSRTTPWTFGRSGNHLGCVHPDKLLKNEPRRVILWEEADGSNGHNDATEANHRSLPDELAKMRIGAECLEELYPGYRVLIIRINSSDAKRRFQARS